VAGLVTGAVEATGVAAGAAVFDFAGVVAGAAAVGVVAAVAGAAAFEAVDFFEWVFFGVVELSAALLSVAAAFFDVVFFFEDAAPVSDAVFELEASASAFFFLPFLVALESP
jgi:hypothetical protein